MPTSNLEKFFLLTWKNWLLQYRRPMQTVLEIVSPILFSTLLVLIRTLVDPKMVDAISYPPYCPIPATWNFTEYVCQEPAVDVNKFGIYYYQIWGLAYSPNSSALAGALGMFEDYFGRLVAIKDSKELGTVMAYNSTENLFAIMQFDDSYSTLQDLSTKNHLKIYLRFPSRTRHFLDPDFDSWKTNVIYPSFKMPGPRQSNLPYGAAPGYFVESFLGLQHMLTIAVIAAKKGIKPDDIPSWLMSKPIPKISMRRFPHPPWYKDELLKPMQYMLGLIMLLSFVYSCINIVRSITTEKEKQLKESMKIMGLSNWLHWSAWFVKCFVFLFISALLIVILLTTKWISKYTVFNFADPTVIILFFIVYICATITFCFAISVMFDKANTAATISGLAWFISYLPYMLMQKKYDRLTLTNKLTGCLFSNTAMGFGFQLMMMFEGTGDGVQWRNLFRPTSPDDSLTLGFIIIMLIIDSIIYLLIALYVEAVFPGEYGVPKPWNFCFTPNYWRLNEPRGEDSNMSIFTRPTNDGEFFEAEPQSMRVGIQISNLSKIFHHKAAVKDLNLSMYEDQITVLLGHNGAGKTTTMSMLTGMIRPTSGTAYVNGYDIRTEIDSVRRSLGLCPQHNIIFDNLTVEEHLYFFSRLKGLRKSEIKMEIDKYLRPLELKDKRNSKSSTLSGGMKRKLCVGMALCGNSKVVMLDEPTAGMDPSARRALWKLLKSQKQGRTILLSTHFMDEADLLGDRIAIMARGGLKCCGSSFFLKKKYGAGYSLILDKLPGCDAAQVTALLRKHIPNVEIYSNVGSELTYLLSETHSPKFEPMLKDLENNSKNLKIDSYGISLTTMEEVFIKVGSDHGQAGQPSPKQEMNKDATLNIGVRPYYKGGIRLVCNQFRAMLMKRALSSYRSWLLLFIQILIAAAHVAFAVFAKRSSSYLAELPPLVMNLEMFETPATLVQGTAGSTHIDKYLQVLREQKGAYEITESIPDRFSEVVDKSPLAASMSYIAGAEFKQDNGTEHITVWFNNDPLHSPGAALALVLNAVYKKALDCDDCSIEFLNHPIPYRLSTQIHQLLSDDAMGFQLAFNLGFAMSFVSSFYVLFIVKENMSKSKHLQFVSGVNVLIFWLTTALWDMFTFMFTVFTVLITLSFFKEEGLRNSSELGRLLLILLLFGWSFLPMVYIAGHFFKISAAGYTRMTIFAVFTGVMGYITVNLMSIKELKIEHVSRGLNWVFLIFPHYCMVRGVNKNFDFYAYKKICKRCEKEECEKFVLEEYCQGVDESYFRWKDPGLGKGLIFSAVVGLVLYILLLCIECKLLPRTVAWVVSKCPVRRSGVIDDEDPDVAQEKERIRNTSQEELVANHTLVLRDLTKRYRKFMAVNSLCLAVNEYECFGLLGVNGAGKTTTFKMMTGDVKISSGDGWVNGYSIKHQLKMVQASIGYCPQFDALLGDLTARETITMFALLRGIRKSDCDALAETLAREFDFQRHIDKQVKALSGGNKRKVSTSIAIIGDPPVIYLDEPTTGMDPATKRYLWNALCKIRDSGKCIVLTSHSMEECEALCTRIAIMVNGQFKCLGSSQHLKNTFAKGYNLSIKLRKLGDGELMHYETGPVENFVKQQFPKAKLRDKHEELMNYYIKDVSRPWSEMFGILEKAKQSGTYNIEDYSLGQGSLEQVFLGFTRRQK